MCASGQQTVVAQWLYSEPHTMSTSARHRLPPCVQCMDVFDCTGVYECRVQNANMRTQLMHPMAHAVCKVHRKHFLLGCNPYRMLASMRILDRIERWVKDAVTFACCFVQGTIREPGASLSISRCILCKGATLQKLLRIPSNEMQVNVPVSS